MTRSPAGLPALLCVLALAALAPLPGLAATYLFVGPGAGDLPLFDASYSLLLQPGQPPHRPGTLFGTTRARQAPPPGRAVPDLAAPQAGLPPLPPMAGPDILPALPRPAARAVAGTPAALPGLPALFAPHLGAASRDPLRIRFSEPLPEQTETTPGQTPGAPLPAPPPAPVPLPAGLWLMLGAFGFALFFRRRSA